MSDRLRRLHEEFGQSPWLDNLSRADLMNGHLAGLVEAGVRGLTSNPTIFQKAIEGSSDYDEQLASELRVSPDSERALWELITSDVTSALELLAPVHAASAGDDGYVSVEVDPDLARDTDATLIAARTIDDRVGRSNLMIKIPATVEGLPVIEELVAEGRHVNVTLIFSLDRYADVIEAHMRGLERRLEAGLPVDAVASVASFFVSRVDTEIDKRLEKIGGAALSLRGTAAVAQAQLAWQLAAARYSGPRWGRLAAAGARAQRPLWASTSTKNPSYPDTMYVDRLIGPGTVNTLPEATLHAFADHGSLARTVDADLDEATRSWTRLHDAGIDTASVAALLEQEGLDSFVASFRSLKSSIASKAAGMGAA